MGLGYMDYVQDQDVVYADNIVLTTTRKNNMEEQTKGRKVAYKCTDKRLETTMRRRRQKLTNANKDRWKNTASRVRFRQQAIMINLDRKVNEDK